MPDGIAPAFELHDLDLVIATKVSGLKLIVETRQEYAEEEVVVVTEARGDYPLPIAICSFYREHGVVRFEWFAPRRHSHVGSVEEALCLVHALATPGAFNAWTGPVWPVSKI